MRGKLLDAVLLVDLSRALRRQESNRFTTWFSEQPGPFYLNPVCVSELLEGATDHKRTLTWLFGLGDVLDITHSTAVVAARLQVRRSARLGENDSWMAATAIEHDLVLVTGDKRFGGTERLKWVTYPRPD